MVTSLSKEQILSALQSIKDPEFGYSIVDLGLIYNAQFHQEKGVVSIQMTFTSPACPLRDEIRKKVWEAISALPNVTHVTVGVVFSPRWSPQMASEEIQQEFAIRGIPLTPLR